nr:nuclear pore complex protein NUP160 isoform X1 [Ipomoea batatas]
MGSRSCLAGMEVPIIGSDAIKWIQLSVPSSASTPAEAAAVLPDHLNRDTASYAVFGNPPTYLIWRINKSQANVVEIMQLNDDKEFPNIGLQIVFPDALFPFTLICENQANLLTGGHFTLNALTISGVAYLIKLKDVSTYISSSVLPSSEVIECNTQMNPHHGAITAVAATAGSIVVGRNDGSVSCFQLGMVEPSAPGFVYELRDDAGFGRLWGIMSRSRTVAAVQDLVISELCQKKLLFVLHSDGILRVWHLSNRSKVLTHNMTETTSVRLWVGKESKDDSDTNIIPLAVLQKHHMEVGVEILSLYTLSFSVGDRIDLSLQPSTQSIPFEKGGLIDLRLTQNKLWMLKEDGLVMRELFYENMGEGLVHCYSLQEAFVADQLFQSFENSSDDLLWLSDAVLSSSKVDEIASFVSYIFLRRLLLPGIHHNTILRATLRDYNKHFTDSEFDSLTIDGLKNEILSLIEHEGGAESPVSIVYSWKSFCTRYFNNWCHYNAACALLVDSSTGAIGLIRKNTISLCRSLENIELLIFGSFDEFGNTSSSGLNFSADDLEREVLFEVLQCISNLSQQLGRASSAIYYEALLRTPNVSPEDVTVRLLKTVESGYSPSTAYLHSELGADVARDKEISNHRSLRRFSVNMFLSLHNLCTRAITWGKVLDVIESYLKYLVPLKIVQDFNSQAVFNINTAVTVQATSQVAKVMFESTLDVYMLLSYMLSTSGKIHLSQNDVSRIKLELVPMIQEMLTEWHIIHFFATTPSESPVFEDFSSQLSSLHLDSNEQRSWNEKLGKSDFTLAFLLLLSIQGSSEGQSHLSFRYLPDPASITNSVQQFTSWIIWGRKDEESSVFLSHSVELALILLRHGQYDAVEYMLNLVESYLRKERTSESLQSVSGEWSKILHLLGCSLIAQTQRGLHGMLKERKICEAVRCFFRAASAQGASKALQSLPYEAGWLHLGLIHSTSTPSFKLHYYQWAMQIFEQYSMSQAACQFALAALELVDESLGPKDGDLRVDPVDESPSAVKGRLWANVFKFTLDLNLYYDAYCAIISNPDEESKNICLRRFVIVLYERGAVKILCNGQLPFIGLTDKVERELAWKAERSDVSTKPNPFRLLYAFEMQRHNWRKAASYIYLYSSQLRTVADIKDHQRRSLLLQERLNGLSASINALQLVHPTHAWIDGPHDDSSPDKDTSPTAGDGSPTQRRRSYIDVQKLENEFILTSAEYLLSLANIKWTFAGTEKLPPDIVDLLVESNLYDMAFTVILKFWKGSALKRELEKVFATMALKCCPSRLHPSSIGNEYRMKNLLLMTSHDEIIANDSPDAAPIPQQSNGNGQWETLELYLDKYEGFHARLPVVVAETLLAADPQIELPLWLVQMFKSVQRESSWGMAGSESNPASLFRLYVDYGRFTEATNLLLEYIESFACLRPMDIIRRKRSSAVWFPYTLIERLWCQLEQSIKLGHMVDQSEKLKKMLHTALRNHLNLVKVDSDDVLSSAA